jgi:DNA-binding SARP family transcriptional activator
MTLDDGKPIRTRGKLLDIEFSLWVRQDNVFGSLFRMITNKGDNIDLMYYWASNTGSRHPLLLIGEEVYLLEKEVRVETWLPVSLSLDPVTGKITLRYDEEEVVVSSDIIKGVKSVRIAFGHCPFEGFTSDDIASVNVKDILLKRDNREIRFWKMAQHVNDTCYDEISGSPAVGINTKWLMDDHITWLKIHEQTFDVSPSIAYDPVNHRFFAVTDQEMHIIMPPLEKEGEEYPESSIEVFSIVGGNYAANAPNQLIYIPSMQTLLSYNQTEDIYSVFDFSLNSWKNQQRPSKEHNYWNSTVVFNPKDSVLISFGGYGHYHYNNELLFCYPFHENRLMKRLNLWAIDPRYSPASNLLNGQLYVFGGRGSPSGRQELAPRNYYDFYSVDLTNQSVKLFWSLQDVPRNEEGIPSKNMIYDNNDDCFYVFMSESGGILMRIDTLHAVLEPMSLPIWIEFDTYHYIYTNLFLSHERQKLYVSVLLSQVSGESLLEIYEMNYPTISPASVQQGYVKAEQSINWKGYLLVTTVMITIVSLLLISRHGRRKASMRKQRVAKVVPKAPPTDSIPSTLEEETRQGHYNFTRQCICLLGRFQVFNKKGEDITPSFSRTLKSLLVALICYSASDTRGISGNELIQLLWHDKSREAAKNNRNVYVSKLRVILEEIGGIKVINQKGYWRIQLEENVLCDYLEVVKLFEAKENEQVEKILELLTRGAMLPNMETDWIDIFKNDLANNAIDFLSGILKDFTLSDSQKLIIADTLFQYDFLNEEALQVKCTTLYGQSKIGLAKTVYDTFCNQFEASIGVEYPFTFGQVVEQTK